MLTSRARNRIPTKRARRRIVPDRVPITSEITCVAAVPLIGTGCGAGRDPASLTRSSSAMIIQFATSDGPAGGQERRREAGDRDQVRDAADDDEHLQPDDEREAAREQPAEDVACGERRAHPALDQDRVQHEHRHQAGEAELLADRRRR